MTADADFAIVPIVSMVSTVSKSLGLLGLFGPQMSQKKVFTMYIDTYNNIYISDIIISIIYTTLITLGSEIRHQERMGRDLVLLFSNIG